MTRLATALCALTFTVAFAGAALADCPGHASAQPHPTSTDSKGT